MSFELTLTPAQHHLVHRLESFGDVIFGFSVSQLAFQLVLPKTPSDMIRPTNFAVYGATFIAIVYLWFIFHRMLSNQYAPLRLELIFTMIFLLFVTLVPYAMYTYVHFVGHVEWIRASFGPYLACSVGTTIPSAFIAWRNFPRAWYHLDAPTRLLRWRRVCIVTTLATFLTVALAVDALDPIQLAWGVIPPTGLVLSTVWLGILLVNRTVGRQLPSAEALRIPPEAAAV